MLSAILYLKKTNEQKDNLRENWFFHQNDIWETKEFKKETHFSSMKCFVNYWEDTKLF